MIDVTIKDFLPQLFVLPISNDARFTLTEAQARALSRALAQVLEEPKMCGMRATCALYPKNKVAYHDEGAADPAVVVRVRED
jgi:hypothetical protein